MKLKYLIRLNALLILCSIAITTMAKESLTLETKFDAPKPYSVKKVDNPILKGDIAKKKKFNSYRKCDVKTGLVNQIVKIDDKKRELTLQPVYYQLNTQSLNLYDTMSNKAQLISVLNIDKVVRLLEIYSGTHCITFVVRLENKKESEALTVCPDNIKDKDTWTRMITEFKECDIHVTKSEVNEQVLMDFSKVNSLLTPRNPPVTPRLAKVIAAIPGAKAAPIVTAGGRVIARKRGAPRKGGRMTRAEEEKDLLDGMYYDNSQKTVRKSPKAVVRTQQMKKQVKSIIQEIQMGNLAQKKLQREYQGKIAQAERVAKEVEQQKEIVREILQKRAEKQQERKAVTEQKTVQNKELQLMKAVKMQIQKIKTDEIKETKQALKKQLNFIKGIPEPKGIQAAPAGSILRGPGGKIMRGPKGEILRSNGGVMVGSDGVMVGPSGTVVGPDGVVIPASRASSRIMRIPERPSAGAFAGTLPSGFGSPLSRALIAKFGPLGDNKLQALAASGKGYSALARASSSVSGRRGYRSLAASRTYAGMVTRATNGKNGKIGKFATLASAVGRNTNFAKFSNVVGGIPKDASGFTATGIPIKVGPKGEIVRLTSTNPDSPNKLLSYNTCTEKDRLWGKTLFLTFSNFFLF
jgi:hypothetical protein